MDNPYNKIVPRFKDIPLVWALDNQSEIHLSELADLSDRAGKGIPSTLPRAVIVAGIAENQLRTLMTVCRQTGMKQTLWATLTPTSETWMLKELLAELSAERRALKKIKTN